jgi:protein-S-isoprenylcysteine O-methyltransferase Ste14
VFGVGDPKGVRFVAVQAALFVAVGAGPGWFGGVGSSGAPRAVAVALLGLGLALALAAGFRLGRNLTPLPVPIEGGSLVTAGVYAFARHPIYGGVLVLALGWSALHGSLGTLAATLGLWALFEFKSRFEERALLARYPDYARYRAGTRRFVPFVY